MRNTAITQLALVGISIVIIVTFIRPTFANIRAVQDEIYQYADATAKANEFNTLLQQLLARERSFSSEDKHALEMFLPTEIDQLAVMQDIETIVTSSGGEIVDMKAGPLVLPNEEVEFEDYFEEQVVTADKFVTQNFEVKFNGGYFDFTSMLRKFESAAYMLEIEKLSFGDVGEATGQYNPVLGEDEIEFSMVVKVYALAPASAKQ